MAERRHLRARAALPVALALLVTGCGSSVKPPPDAGRPTVPPSLITSSGEPTAQPTNPTTAPPAPPTSASPGTPTGTRSAPRREKYHRLDGQTYRFENSYRGLDYAVAHGYTWIDIDTNYCLDDAGKRRIPIATHWGKIDTEGFDPEGRYAAGTRWPDLKLSQVLALRTADNPPDRIHTFADLVRYAARVGLEGIEWEVKAGVGFERVSTYLPILRLAKKLGVKIEVKTLNGLGGTAHSFARLRAAKRAGAVTMLINTPYQARVVITPEQERYVDFVRGKWKRA